MANLSILIPARNEVHLQRTIEDIFEHAEGDTEVIVGYDGVVESTEAFNEVIEGNVAKYGDRFVWQVAPTPVGQRTLTNRLARLSNAKYLMKTDGHCSFSPGFDVKLMETMARFEDNIILSPQMGVLYPETWTINGRKFTTRYEFGRDFVMRYAVEGEKEWDNETMCLQGSAWMITRENYWKWNVCDESLGSWGGQAVELGIAAYLNGGKCITTRHAYYGHVFRHQDEEFPYERGENPGQFATEELKRRYEDKIGGLVERFNFPLDWAKQ